MSLFAENKFRSAYNECGSETLQMGMKIRSALLKYELEIFFKLSRILTFVHTKKNVHKRGTSQDKTMRIFKTGHWDPHNYRRKATLEW
jgi:hypothetical protein